MWHSVDHYKLPLTPHVYKFYTYVAPGYQPKKNATTNKRKSLLWQSIMWKVQQTNNIVIIICVKIFT